MIFAVGLIASVLVIAISLAVHQRTIAVISVLLGFFVATQYILLDKSGTAILAIVSLVYAGLSLLLAGNKYWKEKYCIPAVIATYLTVFTVINGFVFNIEILALVGSILMTALVVVRNPVTSKVIATVAGVAWLVYQVKVGAYGQLPGQGFYFTGIAISSVILFRYHKAGKDMSTAPEVGSIIAKRIAQLSQKVDETKTVERVTAVKECARV